MRRLLIVSGTYANQHHKHLTTAKARNEMYMWHAGFWGSLSVGMRLLIKATQTLPIGPACAVWSGIEAVGAVLVGIFAFKELATSLRLLFTTTLIGTIVGLKAVSH